MKKTQAESKQLDQPGKIRLCGQTWVIREKNSVEMNELGLCHTDIHEIWISSSCTPEVKRNTLLHEVLHALSYVGQLRMSERQVDVLATLLIAMTRDNPELVDYFFKEETQ